MKALLKAPGKPSQVVDVSAIYDHRREGIKRVEIGKALRYLKKNETGFISSFPFADIAVIAQKREGEKPFNFMIVGAKYYGNALIFSRIGKMLIDISPEQVKNLREHIFLEGKNNAD